ncbi:MAG TPA: hypothetical protein VFZ44_10075 [Pyrinomonadaceae bacterium]
MSNNSKLRFLVVLLLAAFASASLVLADVGALGQNTNSSPTDAPAAAQSNEDISGERDDLSGTYTGHLKMTGGHEMSGQATLTITGNTFQLSGEGMSHGGRVYAVITRGETSAAFYFTDITDPTTNTPLVCNVRSRKRGESLRLWPAPNARNRMTFATGVATPRGRRGRRAPRATTTDANANTGDNTNTATPPR